VPEINTSVGSNVCVPFVVKNFDDVLGFTFSVEFNESHLMVTSISHNPALNNFNAGSISIHSVYSNIINVLWFEQNFNAQTLPDFTSLFTVCFDVVGSGDDPSPIYINDSGIRSPVHFVDSNFDIISSCYEHGVINIDCPSSLVLDTSTETLINSETKNYKASNFIDSQRSILGTDEMIYKAGNHILLSEEFSVANGTQFHALINNCASYNSIMGKIQTAYGAPIKDVLVSIYDGNVLVNSVLSDINGFYFFENLDIENIQYTIVPEKLDIPLNGNSTLDVVFMTRHLLEVDTINIPPQQLISADTNGDELFDLRDVIELRRLILGYIPQYSIDSWQFHDKESDPNHENIYPLQKSISTVEKRISYDFIGVKVGDVTGNAATN